jgi:hypothetical protein
VKEISFIFYNIYTTFLKNFSCISNCVFFLVLNIYLPNKFRRHEMKKFILAFALLFGGSSLFASSLQNYDQQFLFGNQKVDAQLISQNEMVETEGQWFWVAFRIGWTVYSLSSRSAYLAGAQGR